jgi:hypothetical protein
VVRNYCIRGGLTDLGMAVHDQQLIALDRLLLRFLAILVRLIVLSVRRGRSLKAESLFLRRQLTLYKESIDAATRMSLVFLSRLFD